MRNSILKFTLLFSLILSFTFQNFEGLAQDVNSEMISQEERKVLEEELRELEEQILKYEEDISKTEQEKKTLQNQIYILRTRIEKSNLQIYQSNVIIKDLGFQIEDTKGSIDQTTLKIEDSKEKLIAILRTIYEEDQKSLIEIFLSEDTLSGFFDNLMALEVLNAKNQELLENIKNLKFYLQDQEQALDEEKTDQERVVKIQLLQKRESESIKQEKNYLLELTEAEYQKYLGEKTEIEKKAAEIRSRIFELIGVPEAPTFGEAYEIAKYVSGITGVRPSLLLAVLTQESNIGKNVGQCLVTNTETGGGIRITNNQKEPRIMNPTRDLPYFLEICSKLGRDPFNTPVSCPIKDKYGNPIGWGGAMGPAQFIPSTWADPKSEYDQKVSAVTGEPADPWNIRDAFLASGLYLKDLGASQDEFKAVMRYFSGYRWYKWEEFYGKSVIAIASRYEGDIEELKKAS